MKAMTQGKYVKSELLANMKDFLKINGDLFFRGAEGLLMKCVSRQKGLTLLHKLHYDIYGVNLDVSLYRRLQRLGIFWSKMANDTKEEQGVVKLVPSFTQTKQRFVMANCWKKIGRIHT